MEEELPTEFDLIVIGTGLTESIVAAAASRIGKTVLHLDTNDYYGGYWASFNLDAFRKYLNNPRSASTPCTIENNFLQLSPNPTAVQNGREKWNNLIESGDVDGWNREKIEQEFRRFNIDLTPKLLYARGSMVELLISSNICRYAEFRALDRVATLWEGKIMTVPCSRSDVFTSKDVNVIEKRLLMKFLQSCASYDEGQDVENKPEELDGKTFLEHLQSHKLTPNLIHYVLYTIAMGNDRTPAREGLAGVKKFLMSLGHYGNSPFLFPVYGCGEIPQCFCRLCAVFGGIYCLNKAVEGIHFDTHSNPEGTNRFESVKCGKQNIRSKDLVVGPGYLSQDVFAQGSKTETKKENSCGGLARAVILTNVPFGGASQNPGGGGVAIMKLPPVSGHREGATILQMSHYSGTCPKEIYLIHVTTLALSANPEDDLKPYIAQIFSYDYCNTAPATTSGEEHIESAETQSANTTSTILYEAYFNIPSCVACTVTSNSVVPAGIRLTCGPYHELDYDQSIDQARRIFQDMFPDEEFLPRAPDPEEIIIGEEEPVQEPRGDVTDANDEPVDNASECRDTESDSALAQEAKEEAIDKAEECTEQR
ncbi:rab proteins geranylgeranyltransferase component A [Anopheles ziemanni]|uniref:rab proteins geranylgeranyltransferase component A n=1 Tax=Anopheles coustani TaxID=139045 RepID=UPI002658ADD9|nr:rab proteins geranylgeranyltransferase component A [Anopheles coustani]XP_058171491.1 rab proteins geranylgeranyltransferase component A [Anopheles ziemanni]